MVCNYDAIKFVERRTKIENMSQTIHFNKHFHNKHTKNSDVTIRKKIAEPIFNSNPKMNVLAFRIKIKNIKKL